MLRKLFQLLPLPMVAKKHVKFMFFYTMARLGIVQRPSLNALDAKLVKYLPYKKGVFVEAGANDGISQSNTWYFEAYLEWNGLLIEPVPQLAKMAKRFRRSPVANVALCRSDQNGRMITLRENDLMTRVSEPGQGNLKVEGRTLSNLLDEYEIYDVDLLSLDVEGMELDVLDGLDLRRHAPKIIVVETADITTVLSKLGNRYVMREKLSHHDYVLEWEPE